MFGFHIRHGRSESKREGSFPLEYASTARTLSLHLAGTLQSLTPGTLLGGHRGPQTVTWACLSTRLTTAHSCRAETRSTLRPSVSPADLASVRTDCKPGKLDLPHQPMRKMF